MAIEDLIANGIRPPQVEDMTTASARGLSLANAMQQQKVGQLELQQRQMDMQDQQTMRQAYMQSGGDMNKFQQLVMQNGASPKAITQIQQQILATREAHAKLDETELKNEATKTQAIGSAAQSILSMPDEATRAANWPTVRQQMITQGHAAPADVPEQYPGVDFVTLHRNAAVTAQQSLENVNKEREAKAAETRATAAQTTAATGAAKQEIEAPGQQATAADLVRRNAATQLGAAKTPQEYQTIMASLPYAVAKQFEGKTPDQARLLGMSPDQQVTTSQQAANAVETARNNAEMRRQGNARLQIEQGNQDINRATNDPFGALGINKNPIGGVGAASTHGMEFLGTIPPAMATRVQAIADGRETLSAREKGSPSGRALQTAVEQYDPAWSEQRAQIRKAFTTGSDGRNIGNLNTAPVHLAGLATLAEAMQNGSFVPGNQLYNSISKMLGGSAPTTFEGMKTVVAGEMASAMKGNATDPEIASFNKAVSEAGSPGQIGDVIKQAFMPALATKLQTFNERYHAISSRDDPWSPVLPSARAAFEKYGISVPSGAGASPQAGKAGGPGQAAAGVTVTDPTGTVHTFPSQVEAAKFKKLAGIQ